MSSNGITRGELLETIPDLIRTKFRLRRPSVGGLPVVEVGRTLFLPVEVLAVYKMPLIISYYLLGAS